MDLAKWVTDGRWTALLELIDQLPSASRYYEAISQDDETAEMLLQLTEDNEDPKNQEPWSPRVAEYNLTNTLLVALINEIKTLRLSGQAVAGAKPKKEKPFPAPRTAFERARARREEQEAKRIAFMFGFSEADFN